MAIPEIEMPFDEIIDFLASSPQPSEIVAYHPSEELQTRFSELLQKNRQDTLTQAEQRELDEFLRMNRFMSRLKLKARQNLDS